MRKFYFFKLRIIKYRLVGAWWKKLWQDSLVVSTTSTLSGSGFFLVWITYLPWSTFSYSNSNLLDLKQWWVMWSSMRIQHDYIHCIIDLPHITLFPSRNAAHVCHIKARSKKKKKRVRKVFAHFINVFRMIFNKEWQKTLYKSTS